MVTTKQKPMEDTQKRKRKKKCEHTITENHQIMKKEQEKKKNRHYKTAIKHLLK